jgi:hypothetical protein
MHGWGVAFNTLACSERGCPVDRFVDCSHTPPIFYEENHMSDTQRKTLRVRQKEVTGESPLKEKSVEVGKPDVGRALDHRNKDMAGEQRRRINHPHDDGS